MHPENSTIFALSSGSPPCAIAVIRISGPKAGAALAALANRSFTPRKASLARLTGAAGELLDEALVLWIPGPGSATGEDCAELHCHGGKAVVAAVCAALAKLSGVRPAQQGEFTRRAFVNGRLDLAEAEALADLLESETELQRAAVMASASGVLSRQVEEWRSEALILSAQVEAALDFSDEEDAEELPTDFSTRRTKLVQEIDAFLRRPRSDRLYDGFRVVLAGPPNVGKSTLFNALVESEAAITSAIAGTTRDVIERSVGVSGVPFTFVDTAGLRVDAAEEIESIGIKRALTELERADLVLWLGSEGEGPANSWEISARADEINFEPKLSSRHIVSALSGEGIHALKSALVDQARTVMPKPGEAALNKRQFDRLSEAAEALANTAVHSDLLLKGEELRRVRLAFDRLVGRSTTEDMLDTLFGRFCIGK